MINIRSQRFRITGIIFLLVTMITATFAWFLIATFRSGQEKRILSREDNLLELIALTSRTALLTNELDETQLFIDRLTKKNSIDQIYVTDSHNIIVVSSSFSHLGEELQQKTLPGGVWRFQALFNEAGTLGTIAVLFNRSELASGSRALVKTTLLLFPVVLLAAGLVSWFLGKLLSKRLELLENAVREVAAGDLQVRIDDQGGDEIAAVATAFNTMTSSLRQTVDTLRASEARNRDILQTAMDGFWLTDLQGRLLEVNQAYCRMSGYGMEELLAMSVFELEQKETAEETAAHIQKAIDQLQDRFETRHRRKDGAVIDVEISVQYRPDAGGHFVAFLRDITASNQEKVDRARIEAQLLQAQKMESVGRLAGGVAHDFNNMLGVIIGHVSLGLMKIDSTDSLYNNLVEIERAAERSADLTRQLLAFARKQVIEPKVLDLNDTISGMLKMLQRLIGENINLCWQPGNKLWPIKMDPSQIDQILANLCVNARDAIEKAGKIFVETGIATIDESYCTDHPEAVPGDYVRLSVSDDGCGMNKETLEHIYEPFFTTKGIGEGTGLGLATVYGIVKQNNGFINVYSEPGRGTTFTVYIPRHSDSSIYNLPETVAMTLPRGQETILLAEDEPAILQMTCMLLESLGYTVLAAHSPAEAIRLAHEHSDVIHLLMTDVVMPEMNGRDLASTLMELYPHLKSLFMSGYTADIITNHGVIDEGFYFIQKPFPLQSLAVKVREVLDCH